MSPNYDAAATKAAEILIKHQISATPVDPIRLLKLMPDTLVISFAEIAYKLSEDRLAVVSTFWENQDAITSIKMIGGKLRYIVAINQQLPFYITQRAAARELGHIVLGHDGSRPESVRTEEALCFARHLLCPRPIIKALQDNGFTITVEKLGCITGCYERCLIGMRKTPGCRVPPELNRMLKDQFADYVANLKCFFGILPKDDTSTVADFGTYMDCYEE